jgi:hypothetical protein
MSNKIDEAPEFFLINEEGTEKKLTGKKIRLDYKDGAKVTIEIMPMRSQREIVIRGYLWHRRICSS